jgi:hypothetical protein
MGDLRAIPGHPDYLADSDGSIWSLKHGAIKQMRTFVRDRSGHLGVNLSHGGKYHLHYVHRLVAITWIGPPPSPEHVVRHRDDIPANNAETNLLWGTNGDNSNDMVSKARQSRGEKRPLAKLSPEVVLEIRNLAKSTPQNNLAKRFGVSASTLNSIVLGRTWRHVYAD